MNKIKAGTIVAALLLATLAGLDAKPVSWSEAPDTSNCYYYFPANGCPGCSLFSAWSAWMDRSDSDPVVTDPGTPDTVMASGGDCDNCGSESANSCADEISVEYTESYSESVEAGIEGGEVIKASLKSTIGTEQGRNRTFKKTCTANAGKCSKIKVEAWQNVRLNIKAKVVSTYQCHHDLSAGSAPCASYVNGAGTKKSTATGSKGLMTGACRFTDGKCPKKDCPPCQNT